MGRKRIIMGEYFITTDRKFLMDTSLKDRALKDKTLLSG